MPKFTIEEMESVMRGIVNYELGEPPRYCISNLSDYGFTNEMMRFFGVPREYFDDPVKKPRKAHPFKAEELDVVLSNVVEYELEEPEEYYLDTLYDMGYSSPMLEHYGAHRE